MPVLIVNAGLVGEADPTVGQFLKVYDPEYCSGFGRQEWTADAALAKRFPDLNAALAEWKRVPACRPLRDDGQQNRPLTAYSITFETVA